jgi:hypothetical protein
MRRREFIALIPAACGFAVHPAKATEPVSLGYLWIGVRGSDGRASAACAPVPEVSLLALLWGMPRRQSATLTRRHNPHPTREASLEHLQR